MEQLPDCGQVMVVVLGDEVKMVHQTHRLLEPWMRNGTAEQRSINPCDPIHKFRSSPTKLRQNFSKFTSVVVSVVGFAIAEIGYRKLVRPGQIILHSRHPQGFKIQQVSSLLLGRPFSVRLSNQRLAR